MFLLPPDVGPRTFRKEVVSRVISIHPVFMLSFLVRPFPPEGGNSA
jgi:hypothetical protein